MRIIKARQIRDAVAELAIKANICLRPDILKALKRAFKAEKRPLAKKALKILVDNAKIAKRKSIAICQDTGMAVIFCEIGRNVKIEGNIDKAINNGIRAGYKKGYFRKSILNDPLIRKNTNTNTPCIIHYSFINGDRVKLTVLPKGFGSENASQAAMLKPASSQKDIMDFVVKAVKENGPDACPPLILGIGIGGTLDKAALLAKEATLRPIDKPNTKKHLRNLEKIILKRVNQTGIGACGLGGRATCLGVNILSFATHIAGLPICVNVSCHALRSASKVI